MPKRLIVFTVVFMFLVLLIGPVFANCNICQKGDKGDKGIQGEQGIAGENNVDRTIAGGGIDALLWQSKDKIWGLESQYRYDANNVQHSIYGVVKVNLWDIFNGTQK